MERNSKIDVVRCVSNYLIVLLHAWAAFQYVSREGLEFAAWTLVCSHLSWLAIPCLFMISGFFLFKEYRLSKYPAKIIRRLKRLAVPYLMWNILFVVFYLSLAHAVPRLSARVSSFGLDSFSGAFEKILSLTVAPIDGPLWFLRAIFLLAVFSPIIWGVMRLSRGIITILLCIAWCLLESFLGFSKEMSHCVPAYAIACFVIGGVVAMNGKDLIGLFRHYGYIILGVIACLVRAGIMIPAMMNSKELLIMESSACSILSIVEAPVLLSIFARINIDKIVNSRLYSIFKEMSFFAYAGHFLFCSMILHSIAPLIKGYWPGKFSLLIIMFFCCGILLMMLVYAIGKRLFPRVMKLFDGTL
jgi:hypothetical protein